MVDEEVVLEVEPSHRAAVGAVPHAPRALAGTVAVQRQVFQLVRQKVVIQSVIIVLRLPQIPVHLLHLHPPKLPFHPPLPQQRVDALLELPRPDDAPAVHDLLLLREDGVIQHLLMLEGRAGFGVDRGLSSVILDTVVVVSYRLRFFGPSFARPIRRGIGRDGGCLRRGRWRRGRLGLSLGLRSRQRRRPLGAAAAFDGLGRRPCPYLHPPRRLVGRRRRGRKGRAASGCVVVPRMGVFLEITMTGGGGV
mmetsp:Transcript_32807/g.79388  ORF Transcript_32807/g.79388 Transcript_32807/m.79388 type:complete len:250 (+) Transcript_32807:887-1636(+)